MLSVYRQPGTILALVLFHTQLKLWSLAVALMLAAYRHASRQEHEGNSVSEQAQVNQAEAAVATKQSRTNGYRQPTVNSLHVQRKQISLFLTTLPSASGLAHIHSQDAAAFAICLLRLFSGESTTNWHAWAPHHQVQCFHSIMQHSSWLVSVIATPMPVMPESC